MLIRVDWRLYSKILERETSGMELMSLKRERKKRKRIRGDAHLHRLMVIVNLNCIQMRSLRCRASDQLNIPIIAVRGNPSITSLLLIHCSPYPGGLYIITVCIGIDS